ncbi:hypothetical protein GWK47_020002 [Chionoecetes opilio]|uniref:RNase H type-1 domain-containing protein n=1 Tax=Chionoecetes opilio TaxID=41210 RepID=A0A8J4XRK8_CHIOP|nr:hypothetical protein GWK47_020002 [Chionoecetes opilio]
MCTTRELRQHALMAMAQVASGTAVYFFTDGSVEPPGSGRTVPRSSPRVGQSCLGGRLTTAPHSRTELVAIQHALEHAVHRREATVVIHHRLLDGAAALQQPHPQGQREAHHHHPRQPTEPCRAGRRVRLNWIPSHVGVRGNEAADAGRQASRQRPPASPCTCLPAYSSSRRRRDGPQHTALTRHNRELEARKRQGPGTLQPPHYHPLDATPQQPRADGALLQRVRLANLHREELQEDFEGQVCDHCEMYTRRPLVQIPPGPAPPPPPRGPPGPRRPACRWGAASGREKGGPPSWSATPERRMLGVCEQRPLPADTSRTHTLSRPAG